MMYKNSFVTVLKVDGKILRENGDLVTLPFGSEYSIFMKNKESRRAVVNIEIDGQDVLSGSSLIINGNSELNLERFLANNSHGNRFKFIQKTKQIQDHRGDRIDDGLLRVEVRYEKLVVPSFTKRHFCPPVSVYECDHSFFQPPTYRSYPACGSGGATGRSLDIGRSLETHIYSSNMVGGSVNSVSLTNEVLNSAPLVDEGITVQGSISNQKFTNGYVGSLEECSHVIILRMRGSLKGNFMVEEPITVKTKLVCGTCGKKNKSSVKFCPNCGTCLQEVA